MGNGPNKIKSKMLVALDDDDKVAVVYSERDLKKMIFYLDHTCAKMDDHLQQMIDGLVQLRKEVFESWDGKDPTES